MNRADSSVGTPVPSAAPRPVAKPTLKPSFPQDRSGLPAGGTNFSTGIGGGTMTSTSTDRQGNNTSNDDQFILTSFQQINASAASGSKDRRSRVRLRPTASPFGGYQLKSRVGASTSSHQRAQHVSMQQQQQQQLYHYQQQLRYQQQSVMAGRATPTHYMYPYAASIDGGGRSSRPYAPSPTPSMVSSSRPPASASSSTPLSSLCFAGPNRHQCFTPIKQSSEDRNYSPGIDGRGRGRGRGHGIAATPATVATTPSTHRSTSAASLVTPTSSRYGSWNGSWGNAPPSSSSSSSVSAYGGQGHHHGTPTGTMIVLDPSSSSSSTSTFTTPTARTFISHGTSPNATKQQPRAAPPPQNLRGDPHRQKKVKTELCLYYIKGKACPFGDKCNYAHGWGEMRFKKLKELERNGLIPSASTYRTHPCLSWVTTGSCPFGQRCTSIHDPRVGGSTTSWMPFADSPVPGLKIAVNVDKYYHRHNGSLHSSNPLVGQASYWEKCRPSMMKNSRSVLRSSLAEAKTREWQDVYDLVCNSDDSLHPSSSRALNRTTSSPSSTTGAAATGASTFKKALSEEQRLSIALIMRYSGDCPDGAGCTTTSIASGGFRHDDYVFAPSHLVYNELCMILQTRYFRLLSGSEASNRSQQIGSTGITSVHEIDLEEYNSCRTPWNTHRAYSPHTVIVAREIAFGPVGASDSNVSIWFDIAPSYIVPCTPQMVKRFKRARSKLQKQQQRVSENTPFPPLPFRVSVVEESNATQSFHSVLYQPFFHMSLPFNHDAPKHLIKSILLHRIQALRFRESFGSVGNYKDLSSDKRALEDKFWKLKDAMNKWSWPKAVGRKEIDEETKIPECNALYCFSCEQLEEQPGDGDNGSRLTSEEYVAPLWATFVKTIAEETKDRVPSEEGTSITGSPHSCNSFDTTPADTAASQSKMRVFRDFSQGHGDSFGDFAMPTLSDAYSRSVSSVEDSSTESTSTWKHILLDDDDDNKLSVNPWDLVKQHYLTDSGGSSSNESSPSASVGGPLVASSPRDQALPLSIAGEKRETIFSKLNNGAK